MNPALERFNLKGKSALITGGATGIGLEMTRALAQCGAKVMMAARRENVLKSVAEELMQDQYIDTVLYHPVDLNDAGSVKELSDHVISEWGGADIFIGNAGLAITESIEQVTGAALEQQMRVNLISNIELTRNLMPYMRKKKWGRFIYSSSIGGQLGGALELVSVYGAAKSGLNTFAKYVAAEGGRDGITANVLVIGFFLTEINREHMKALGEEGRKLFVDGILSSTSLGRPAQPHEAAGLVQLLASDAGSYITGTCIPVDGGHAATLRPNPLAESPAL